MYIHELKEWPDFRWDENRLEALLSQVKISQSELFLQLSESCFDEISDRLRSEAALQMLTEEVVKTSDIEGEKLDPDLVRSSIARKLGLDMGGLRRKAEQQKDRSIEGIVNVVLDASHNWKEPLTKERLYKWHGWLFPVGYGDLGKVSVGQWRDGPMQVISSPFNKQRVHFEAPGALRLPSEMDNFLNWFEIEDKVNPILKAGIAHLYFVTVHPFDDGNGRIARAITDLAMARADSVDQRFYSMSAQIRADRKDYYSKLEETQKGTLEITEWLNWFLECLLRSLEWAKVALVHVIRKAHVLKQMETAELNDRQRKIMLKFLDGGFGEFLNSSKYKHSASCSADTANRDLVKLVDLRLLERTGQGKSTSYRIAARHPEAEPPL